MRRARGDTRCELWPASIDSLQSCDDVTLVTVKVDFQQPRSTKYIEWETFKKLNKSQIGHDKCGSKMHRWR